jgi:hypothetical protein
MEIAHANLNFGNMDKNERRTKRIVIRNHSEAPLLYRILKSGSIASGDLRLTDGQIGIVRGYSKREVEFEFEPSLPGAFQERLTIENIQNPSNNQTVTVKANVKQPQNFFISNILLDFGPTLIDQNQYSSQDIKISNASSKLTKIFEVRVDPQDLKFAKSWADIWFSLPDGEDFHLEGNYLKDGSPGHKVMMTKEMEEQIEQLEQKLKIAERKEQTDKIHKINNQLKLLVAGNIPSQKSEENEVNHSVSNYEARGKVSDSPKPQFNSGQRIRRTDCSIIFPVAPRAIRTVNVFYRPIRIPIEKAIDGDTKDESITAKTVVVPNVDSTPEICNIRVYVNEFKNTDVI